MSVWNAFSSSERTALVMINGDLKKEKYKEILETKLVPLFLENHGSADDVVFQQDNRGPHESKSVSAYLHQEGIEVTRWPAQSLDFNPIERECDFFKEEALYP